MFDFFRNRIRTENGEAAPNVIHALQTAALRQQNVIVQERVRQMERATAEVRYYTAEDVQNDVSARMLLMLEEIRECVEKKQLSDALIAERNRLQKLGLTSTKNAQIIKEKEEVIAAYNAKVDRLRFMTEVWDTFGHDVMVLSYKHFMEVLEKYDLVCGTLDRYEGSIPEKNLQEIERIMDMNVKERFAQPMRNLECIVSSASVEKHLRFPFEQKGDYMGDNLADMGIRRSWETKYSDISENSPRFFIAAPRKEMGKANVIVKTGMFDTHLSTHLQDYTSRVETKDPFFCSCSDFGVLIYSKWGDEAQDDIIKRYEALSKTINQNKSLTI